MGDLVRMRSLAAVVQPARFFREIEYAEAAAIGKKIAPPIFMYEIVFPGCRMMSNANQTPKADEGIGPYRGRRIQRTYGRCSIFSCVSWAILSFRGGSDFYE